MKTDEESDLFNGFLEPSITEVQVHCKLSDKTVDDEYELRNSHGAPSYTIQDLTYITSDSRYSGDSEESLSTLTQADNNTLQRMTSYCFDEIYYGQNNLSNENFASSTDIGKVDQIEKFISEKREVHFPPLEIDRPKEKSHSDQENIFEGSFNGSTLNSNEESENEESNIDDNVYLTSADESTAETESISDHEMSDRQKEIDNVDTVKRKHYRKEKLMRKRTCRPENWGKNVRKHAVNHGLDYVHTKTNEVVPARLLKRSCGPGCRFKCETKINESRRKEIFDIYWNIPNQSGKYNFISRYVDEKRNCQENEKEKKSFSRKYTLTNQDGNAVDVCKTMFLNTLSISHKVVDTTLRKKRDEVGVIKDMRGTSNNYSRKISEDKTASVIEHINTFPRVESHYTRKDSQREYLEENLSLSAMYRLYLTWCEDTNKPKASIHHYTNIFNTEFNISFFKPKKDQCDHCEKFKNATQSEKSVLEIEYQLHIENKEKARLEKANDILLANENREKTSLICFDFQKVLNAPKTDTGILYYKRKLSVYNFTVYDVVRQGSNEVASCLLHYFITMASEGINQFLLYSDNCSGQNRNKNLFAMYTFASSKYNIDIKHTFPEVGHTQNEGDSVHAQIERYAKGRKIYSMSEWCDVIRSAKINNPKYEVINVNYDMIYDFKTLAENQNWNKVTIKNGKQTSTPVGVSKFKIITASKTLPNQLQYKTSFEGNYITLATRKEREHVNVTKYNLTKVYDSVQGLPQAKLKDLISLCKSNVIPPAYHEYYKTFSIKLNKDNSESGDE